MLSELRVRLGGSHLSHFPGLHSGGVKLSSAPDESQSRRGKEEFSFISALTDNFSALLNDALCRLSIIWGKNGRATGLNFQEMH